MYPDKRQSAKPQAQVYNGQPVYGNFMMAGGNPNMQYQQQPPMQYQQQPMMMARPSVMHPGMHGGYSSQNNSMMMMNPNHYDDDDEDDHPASLAGSRLPSKFYCKRCRRSETSFVHYEIGTGSWIVCILLLCYVPPYCFLPFCIDSCKDVVHECPGCQSEVGHAKFLFE
mmetsp:Transcript_55130/g.63383  ORF Transcript_55130/g.63383 Transcript_55130/m.63383 type:complete len:169 (+) Transcript_55130:35-541(+)